MWQFIIIVDLYLHSFDAIENVTIVGHTLRIIYVGTFLAMGITRETSFENLRIALHVDMGKNLPITPSIGFKLDSI